MRRATPSERRELLGTKIASRARAVAARGRRNSKRGLVDRHVDLYFRNITRRELDDARLNLRPTRRSAPRSPPPSTLSAWQSPPPSTRSAWQSTRRRSPTPPPRSLRRRSPTPPPRSLRRRSPTPPPRSLRRQSPTPPLRTA